MLRRSGGEKRCKSTSNVGNIRDKMGLAHTGGRGEERKEREDGQERFNDRFIDGD